MDTFTYTKPELPLYDVPEEIIGYGEGAYFKIVHEEPGNQNSPLKFLHAFTAVSELPMEK